MTDSCEDEIDEMLEYAIYCDLYENLKDDSGSGGNSGCSIIFTLGAIGSAALSLSHLCLRPRS